MDQHFLKLTKPYEDLLKSIPLKDQNIMEIGVGTGALTQLIHACNPRLINGFEIDTSLVPPPIPSLDLIYDDILTTNLDFLESGEFYLISNPPYCILPQIKERIIDRYPFKGIIMMVSQKYRPLFPDMTIALTFDHTDFIPETKPTQHHVLCKIR